MSLELGAIKTPYVIVGGLATALYMRERVTLDVDILVLERDAEQIAVGFRAAGCHESGPLAFGGGRWGTPDGSDLYVLESDEPWAVEAISSPRRSPTGLPVIDLPYLVLMKLDASRLIDVGDLGRMLGAADEEERDRVRDVIRRHRPDQVEDLESLIALGALEYLDG